MFRHAASLLLVAETSRNANAQAGLMATRRQVRRGRAFNEVNDSDKQHMLHRRQVEDISIDMIPVSSSFSYDFATGSKSSKGSRPPSIGKAAKGSKPPSAASASKASSTKAGKSVNTGAFVIAKSVKCGGRGEPSCSPSLQPSASSSPSLQPSMTESPSTSSQPSMSAEPSIKSEAPSLSSAPSTSAAPTACTNLEGEGCATSYPDTFNAGRNYVPNVFSNITFYEPICGNMSTFIDYLPSCDCYPNFRDTDWYRFQHEGGPVAVTLEANAPSLVALLTLYPLKILLFAKLLSPPDTITVTRDVPAGVYYIFVGTTLFGSGLPCGSGLNEYTVTLTEGSASIMVPFIEQAEFPDFSHNITELIAPLEL